MDTDIDFEDPKVSAKLVAAMIEKTPVACMVLDRNYRIYYINDSYKRLRKVGEKDVLGSLCYDVYNHGEPCELCSVRDSLASGTRQSVLRKDVLGDGTVRYIDDHAIPLIDDDGTFSHVLEIMVDLSPLMSIRDKSTEVFLKIVNTLISVLEKKDEYTSTHSNDVCMISRKLARFAGMTGEQVNRVTLGALLHDIGKVHIPDKIIGKPGPLTKEEFDEIKRHPLESFNLVKELDTFEEIKHICLSHHERWDGLGYPNGTRARETPHEAYVVGLADAYDAMTSNRPYRKGMPHAKALEQIRQGLRKQFDPELGQLFLDMATFFLPNREQLIAKDEQVITDYLSRKNREHQVTRLLIPAGKNKPNQQQMRTAFDKKLVPLILRHSPAPYCIVDPSCRVLYASRQMARMFGYASPADLQGLLCSESVSGCAHRTSSDHNENACPAQAALLSGETRTGTVIRHLPGGERHLDLFAVPLAIDNKQGEPVNCAMVLLFDRTEEASLKRNLEKSIQSLLVLLEQLIMQIDPFATTNAPEIIRECGTFSEFLERMAAKYQ